MFICAGGNQATSEGSGSVRSSSTKYTILGAELFIYCVLFDKDLRYGCFTRKSLFEMMLNFPLRQIIPA